MDPRPWQPGWLLADRYQLQELVGRGGMGAVFRADDRRLARSVAVKVLFEQHAADPAARQRLEREARAAAGIHSPHVVQVYDAGFDADRPYIIMEYLAGGTLAQAVAGRLPLVAAAVVDYGRQIAAGLAAAHAIGLTHRDISLRNVLLDSEGRLKIADFGITTAARDPRLTRTGQAMGTPTTMAPEQAQGQPATPATDVYALGALLYELAVARPPFTGDDIAVVLQHIQAPPVPPRHLNPEVPVWLERIILRALSKAPADRYADGAAIGQALALGVDDVVAAPRHVVRRAPRPTAAAVTTTTMPRAAVAPEHPATVATSPTTVTAAAAQPHRTSPPPSPIAAGRVAWRRRVGLAVGGLAALLLLTGLLAFGWSPRTGGGTATVNVAAPATGQPTNSPAMTPVRTVAPTSPPTVPITPVPTDQPAPVVATTTAQPSPTAPPPTAVPPTVVPPTQAPPTAIPATPAPTSAPPPPTATAQPEPPPPVAGQGRRLTLEDTDFAGGFRNPGESRYADGTGAERTATWIYGGRSEYPAMTATFTLKNAGKGGGRLTLVGMDAEGQGRMPVEISLNDRVLYRGPNRLADWRWSTDTHVIPPGVLRDGENRLTVRSLSDEANFNSPPFFMLDAAQVERTPGNGADDDD